MNMLAVDVRVAERLWSVTRY